MNSRAVIVNLLACMLAGCVSYRPIPILPARRAERIQARSLEDPRLLKFIAAVTANPDAQLSQPGALRSKYDGAAQASESSRRSAGEARISWSLSNLTLAAVYYHPSLTIARAQFREAQASVRTARERPNPSLSFEDLSRSVAAPMTWTVSPIIDFLLETAGKRARRVQQAEALMRAARDDIATASWQLRASVRDALLNEWAAQRRMTLLRARLDLQAQLITLLEHRFAIGEASALDLQRERLSGNQLRLAINAAEQQAADARTALAEAIGIPTASLQDARLSFSGLPEPRAPPNEAELRRQALTGRSDIQAMLAQYAAADSDLALEVANQYPNLTLGPGYSFDSQQDRYILLPQLELPIFNDHKGAIDAALGRRQEFAARFTALQLKVIGQIDGAMADYRATSASLATADTLLREEQDRVARSEQTFRAGALDRPTLLTVQIEGSVTQQARFDALVNQRRALGSLEDALQYPLYDPHVRWLAAATDPQSKQGS
jgi:outer membrane protein TolC